MEYRQLVELAFEIREFAYAPYSGFKSGAVILCENGEVYTGCNVEIASFTPSVSACQAAISSAITNGNKAFKAIAIVGGSDDEDFNYCAPSGVCRQMLEEFCKKDFNVIMAKSVNEFVVYNFDDLFPVPFGKKNIIS
ncbi:MAG: cytidine deaminase [Clostridia bacterium]|nr:cytidine deaminase [Clostridia bacterium]